MISSDKTYRIAIIGTAHPFRGGLAAYNERLAMELSKMGHEVAIYTFTLQYPSFLFPGKSQFSNDPAPKNLTIIRKINSINPISWLTTGLAIRKYNPDLVIVKFWLPFMGPCFGTILRFACRKNKTSVISILDNVIPHEKRPGDSFFTKYFIKACDGFIAMSKQVFSDLKKFTNKPAELVPHPLYDHFGEITDKKISRQYLGLPANDKIILFFGFIRHYKGLDLLLEALTDERIQSSNISLLVAGEFYEDAKPYMDLIEKFGLKNRVILNTDFIPDKEVKYYFCAADVVVQPYRSATQSGITPMAYHFERPMIVTDVGGLPEIVPDEKVGLIAKPDPKSLADAILKFYSVGEQHFIEYIKSEKQKYGWDRMAQAIIALSHVQK